MSLDVVDHIRLDERDQEALAAAYLHLTNAALEAVAAGTSDRAGAVEIRDELRARISAGSLGPRQSDGRLGIEDEESLHDLLATSNDTARCLAMLVELAATQPFASRGVRMDEHVRARTLEWLAMAFGGDVDEDDVEAIDEHLEEAQAASQSNTLKWVIIGGAGLIGVATAGLAAPAIGAAIGGAMGLSGAAATSAGLAWLGGGALAAGGFGMAGGTIIVAGAGGVAGLGLGALAGSVTQAQQVDAEAMKLFALVRSFDRYGQSHPEDWQEIRETSRAGLGALGRQLEKLAADLSDDASDESERKHRAEQNATVVRRLHKRLGDVR